MRRIGLADRLRWRATQTGFYVDRAIHPLSSGLDFLRFPLLNLWSKFRLAATILYCSRINDWRHLEGMTVEEFLVRHSGRATFEKMWKPAPARKARRKLPPRVGRLHLDLREAALFGPRRRRAERAPRLRVGRLSHRIQPPARADQPGRRRRAPRRRSGGRAAAGRRRSRDYGRGRDGGLRQGDLHRTGQRAARQSPIPRSCRCRPRAISSTSASSAWRS